jgi:hypothetical protein
MLGRFAKRWRDCVEVVPSSLRFPKPTGVAIVSTWPLDQVGKLQYLKRNKN